MLQKLKYFVKIFPQELNNENFKAPVRGLFAGDETVTPNGASDIMPYVGRKRALGCALFPMY